MSPILKIKKLKFLVEKINQIRVKIHQNEIYKQKFSAL